MYCVCSFYCLCIISHPLLKFKFPFAQQQQLRATVIRGELHTTCMFAQFTKLCFAKLCLRYFYLHLQPLILASPCSSWVWACTSLPAAVLRWCVLATSAKASLRIGELPCAMLYSTIYRLFTLYIFCVLLNERFLSCAYYATLLSLFRPFHKHGTANPCASCLFTPRIILIGVPLSLITCRCFNTL